jgi:hypothetical protein
MQNYEKFDKMLEFYKDSDSLLNKIKGDKKMAIKQDMLDMQLERVRLKTEMEMLDKAINITN